MEFSWFLHNSVMFKIDVSSVCGNVGLKKVLHIPSLYFSGTFLLKFNILTSYDKYRMIFYVMRRFLQS
jgi:hypothetical protein